MKRTKLATSLCAMLALGATSSTMAADDITISRPSSSLASRLYLGASVGNASYDQVNDSSAAFALFGGYQLNEVLSVDLSYSDLGKAEKQGDMADASTFSLGIMGRLPIKNDFSLFGKVGLSRWSLDADSAADGSSSDNDIDVSYGLGADYDISGSTAVRFGLDFYSLNAPKNEQDINVFSIGFVYKP